jgi:hydroxymethylpyrimidine/phosphomethylpyrimidine kinase
VNGRVLVIAGSDPSGGAGVQADIKTITALGGYAAAAISALTVQDTVQVHEVQAVDAPLVARQVEVVLDDIGADCIKIGMLGSAAVVESVAEVLERKAAKIPCVTDPVMSAGSGTPLLEHAAISTLKRRLLPLTGLLTPNVPEAEMLTGMRIEDQAQMVEAARRLLRLGPGAVLIKGGHLAGDPIRDCLVTGDKVQVYTHPRIGTAVLHGTGCTLASAIATGLAQGLALDVAVQRALDYLLEAIRCAPDLGRGRRPLAHRPWREPGSRDRP